MFRPAADQDRNRLRVLAARDEGHLVIADLLLVDELGVAEVVLRELVELRDDLPARGLRQLLHVGLLDPPDGVDFLLREVVLREVVDAFLAEEHVRAALPDGLDHPLQHPFLLVEEGLELGRIRDLDLRVDLRLLDFEGRVDQGDLPFLHFARHAGVDAFLVHDDPVHELRVGDRSALLLDDLDVVVVDEVRAIRALLRDRRDGLDGDVGEQLLVPARGLRGHRGHRDLLEGVQVLHGNLHRDLLEDLPRLVRRLAVARGDYGRMNVLFDQVFRLLEQLSREDDRRGRAVAGLLVLGLRDLDEHLGRRVLDVNLLQDRHAIVRDHDVPEAVDQHLVHPAGPEGRADRVRNGLRRGDVVELRSLAALAASPFLQNQNRRSCWHHVNLSEYGIRRHAYVETSI